MNSATTTIPKWRSTSRPLCGSLSSNTAIVTSGFVEIICKTVELTDNPSRRNCNDGLKTYQPGTCYSTADTKVKVEYIGVGNNRLGFNWQCQAYTWVAKFCAMCCRELIKRSDNACTTEVLAPAQPCTIPPPFDVYCRDTSDWHGVFGGSGNPTDSESNPSGLAYVLPELHRGAKANHHL